MNCALTNTSVGVSVLAIALNKFQIVTVLTVKPQILKITEK